jgi:hypothetical protein
MITRIALALALTFAALATVPASAQTRDHEATSNPRTCGYQTLQYDSSGATVGPYCD